jgi:hypothetical protein
LTALDPYDNTDTNYTGGHAVTFTGPHPSPNNTNPAYPASVTFTQGVGPAGDGSTTIRLFDAESTTLTATAAGAVSGTTPASFTVLANSVASLVFSDPTVQFNGQPVDTKLGAPNYSKCVPPAASQTNPCAVPPTSTPVQVLARDAYGNLAINPTKLPVQVTLNASTGQNIATGSVPSGSTTGIASFPSPTPINAALGTYTLTALVTPTPSITVTSQNFQLVADLAACHLQKCENKATTTTGNKQSVYGKATTTSAFDPTAVLLTSQFIPGQNFSATKCGGNYVFASSQNTEVKTLAQNGSISATSPAFLVALIVPKATLQAGGFTSRSVNTFNVCVGATWLAGGTVTPWTAKTSPTNSTLRSAVVDIGDPNTFWGWAADCSALSAAQRQAGNPCVSLRTKDAAILGPALGLTAQQVAGIPFKSSDLAIVVSAAFPWDLKFGGP